MAACHPLCYVMLGPRHSVADDMDQQVAGMVNFLFDKGIQEVDYEAVSEVVVPGRPKRSALAPVLCIPQILGAWYTDAI